MRRNIIFAITTLMLCIGFSSCDFEEDNKAAKPAFLQKTDSASHPAGNDSIGTGS